MNVVAAVGNVGVTGLNVATPIRQMQSYPAESSTIKGALPRDREEVEVVHDAGPPAQLLQGLEAIRSKLPSPYSTGGDLSGWQTQPVRSGPRRWAPGATTARA